MTKYIDVINKRAILNQNDYAEVRVVASLNKSNPNTLQKDTCYVNRGYFLRNRAYVKEKMWRSELGDKRRTLPTYTHSSRYETELSSYTYRTIYYGNRSYNDDYYNSAHSKPKAEDSLIAIATLTQNTPFYSMDNKNVWWPFKTAYLDLPHIWYVSYKLDEEDYTNIVDFRCEEDIWTPDVEGKVSATYINTDKIMLNFNKYPQIDSITIQVPSIFSKQRPNDYRWQDGTIKYIGDLQKVIFDNNRTLRRFVVSDNIACSRSDSLFYSISYYKTRDGRRDTIYAPFIAWTETASSR